MGILIFALSLSFTNLFQSPKSYAITAANENQLKSLASSLKFDNTDTITGKIGSTTITFNKKTRGLNGIYYEATNLDCNGEKARVENLSDTQAAAAGVDAGYNLFVKFRQGGGCSELKRIKSNLTPADATNAPENEEAGADEDNCESSGFSLSWIICPVIEAGYSATDFLFNRLVRPLLEDVPVSTDPKDSTYIAWKSFRTLGNIVLVGTLVAVVYAQIKGSDR